MSFQAYLDNIKSKTGKTPDDFKQLAAEKGLLGSEVKAGEIVAWLKTDFGLGHGHAMAIYTFLKDLKNPEKRGDDAVDKHFSGKKAAWRPVFDGLIQQLKSLSEDLRVEPTNTYLSLLKKDKKFAVVQVTAERLDIGIKLKDAEPTDRLEASGTWNAMVTHRVRVTAAGQIDAALLDWMRQAIDKAS